MTRPATILFSVLLSLSSLWGCRTPVGPTADLLNENAELKQERLRLLAAIEAQEKRIETLNEALSNFSELGDRRINQLYSVNRIDIDRLSGGADFDGQPGDDGITIYLKLYDQDNHEFKSAGEIHIYLYDYQKNPPDLIGEYKYDVAQAKRLWFGRLWTYHYKIKCPWSDHPPSGRTVQARVTFLDYLTGNIFEDTEVFEITPLPKTIPPHLGLRDNHRTCRYFYCDIPDHWVES